MQMEVSEFLSCQAKAVELAKAKGISFEEANRIVLNDRHKKKKEEMKQKASLLADMLDATVAIGGRIL
jgi:electron transfer flavoprotein alpha subunit